MREDPKYEPDPDKKWEPDPITGQIMEIMDPVFFLTTQIPGYENRGQILIPWMEGKVDSGIGLKVPKREIFDRSDFPDFYTIKSLRVGDFGVKIK